MKSSPYKAPFLEANHKFMRGDAISDTELALLRKFYQDLVFKLEALGPVYGLAANDALHRLFTLDAFATARKERLSKRSRRPGDEIAKLFGMAQKEAVIDDLPPHRGFVLPSDI